MDQGQRWRKHQKIASQGECPTCGSDLVEAVEKRFQTLSEHVTSPNRQPPMRMSYACPNLFCEAHVAGRVWLADGEGPYIVTEHPEDREET